jgi:radical SAM superfamily enzyme YgiQ (UPF0313 family)
MKPNVLMIVLPYLKRSDESKAGYWGEKYAKKPSTKMNSWPALPYGVLSIATYCKDVANIKILDCNVIEDYALSVQYEMLHQPSIVGFNMTFDNSYPYLKEILAIVRRANPSAICVVGGAATAPVYDEILEDNDVDAVCYGEGEIPFRELCMENSLGNYAWVWKGQQPIKSPVPDLDKIIALDYSFVNPADYYMAPEFSPYAEDLPHQRRFFIVTSKGCPYRCGFCYRSRENDRKMRFASVDAVMAHVKDLVDRYGMNALTICDDQFLVNMKRAKEILRRLIPYKLRLELLQGESVAFIDEEMANLMYQAGVRRAVLAIESGSQEILDKMVDKPVDLKKAKETIKILRAAGLWVTAVFVMGFPGETDRHRRETLSWIQSADLDWCTFSAAVPIKGTKLYQICVDGGYIRGDIKLGNMDFSNYFIGPDPDHVAKEIYKLNLLVNFVENRAMRKGDYETALKSFEQVLKMCPTHAFAQFFKSQCLFLLDRPSEEERNKASQMMDADPQWREYADIFLQIGGPTWPR